MATSISPHLSQTEQLPQNIKISESSSKKLAKTKIQSSPKKLEDESFELFSEICAVENHNNQMSDDHENSKNLNSLKEMSIDLNKNPTVQSEYEQNSKINDISLDSSANFIKEICGAPFEFYKRNDSILDDISLDKKSDLKVKSDSQKPLLKKSEIQVLQSKREEALKKPMYFNVLIVGASALGKTTFIDVFLSNKFEKVDKIRPPTTDILETTAKIKYGDFHFYLKMIDTPGFTHNTNIRSYFRNLKKNIVERFSKYKKSQLKKDKKEYFQSQKEKIVKETVDERIHLCLYFASAPRINNNDLFLMKKLQKYCNIIPIIAKGDCYTPDEIKEIKLEFNKATRNYGIEFFDCENALDNPEKLNLLKDGPFGPCPPFLIISSLQKIELEPNKFVYCRKYNWGVCNIENPLHCDFTLMYRLLIGYFSLELINLTEFFYKSYLHQKQEKKKKLKESQQKYKIGFGIMTFILGAIYFKKNVS